MEEVGSAVVREYFDTAGFGTVVVVKCARKFVWYELAWKHFSAAWSTSKHQFFVNEGTYSSTCALIVFIP
ncbi:hypothetical protein AAVH_41402 [Aphelenchoides avenae]|nr:hypothetical protein AAVH_41402 [Aphelenchus avenae]